ATDPNGAETAVGVPHPENRGGAVDKNVDIDNLTDALPELDDYDADKAAGDIPDTLPPDQDDGRSFGGIPDVGERAGFMDPADVPPLRDADSADDIDLGGRASNTPDNVMDPTIDNQVNQPDRFQRPAQKPSSP